MISIGCGVANVVGLKDEDDNRVGVQHPLPTDGDSVYEKDVWVEECIVTDWTDRDSSGNEIAVIPFNNLHTRIQNATTDAVKILRIHFKRTISAHQVGLGCFTDGDFSNVKIKLLGSGGVDRTVVDDSANSTKYTSKNYSFEPQLFNALQLEFSTTDTVNLSNITIQKAQNTNSFIQVQKPQGEVVSVQGTTSGNLKVSLEEFDPAFETSPLPISNRDEWRQRVSEGLVPGYSLVQKFGQNEDLNTATYEDIWDGGGTYTYPANGAAPITHIYSTGADVEPIEVQGLDIDGILTVQTVTLTGTTVVALTTPLWRVFRMKNVGTVDIGSGNIVHASDSGKVVSYAQIQNGNNQTLMALYTIPLGHTGYMYQGTNNLSAITRGVGASGRLVVRPYGKVFQLKKTFGVHSDGSGFINVRNDFPGKIPALSDIRVSAIASANGVTLNTTFEILLKED